MESLYTKHINPGTQVPCCGPYLTAAGLHQHWYLLVLHFQHFQYARNGRVSQLTLIRRCAKHKMRPIVTDVLPLSVCVCVGVLG